MPVSHRSDNIFTHIANLRPPGNDLMMMIWVVSQGLKTVISAITAGFQLIWPVPPRRIQTNSSDKSYPNWDTHPQNQPQFTKPILSSHLGLLFSRRLCRFHRLRPPGVEVGSRDPQKNPNSNTCLVPVWSSSTVLLRNLFFILSEMMEGRRMWSGLEAGVLKALGISLDCYLSPPCLVYSFFVALVMLWLVARQVRKEKDSIRSARYCCTREC